MARSQFREVCRHREGASAEYRMAVRGVGVWREEVLNRSRDDVRESNFARPEFKYSAPRSNNFVFTPSLNAYTDLITDYSIETTTFPLSREFT